MKRTDSLVSLILSMSKAERKAFVMRSREVSAEKGTAAKRYFTLYRLIAEQGITDAQELQQAFLELHPEGAFNVEVKYLYEKITETVMQLYTGNDINATLLADLSRGRMLFERSLYVESLELLGSVIERAHRLGFNEILLLAQKYELECLLTLDFPDVTDKDLFERHTRQRMTLKNIGLVTEHASLYNTLRQRMLHIGSIRTPEQGKMLTDLVLSEFYSFSAEPEKSFELERNHRMFQASYLLETGDVRGALDVYNSLLQLFEQNSTNPAVTLSMELSVLEGILRALRHARQYDDMATFVERVGELASEASGNMRANILCLKFQYELVPHLDRGDFELCGEIMARYREPLIDRDVRPIPVRECELQLYRALVELGLGNWRRVNRIIANAMVNRNINDLPLMRTIRLLRLLSYYELGEHDLLQYEARSMMRRSKLTFATERLVLNFISNGALPPMRRQRMTMWNKLRTKLQRLSDSKYERQLLTIFDFGAWIESKLTGESLSKILKGKSEAL